MGFDERTCVETAQQHYENVKKEQLDSEHKRSIPCNVSPSPTPGNSKQGDFSNMESCNMAMGTVGSSNTSEMNKLSSTGLGLLTHIPAVNISSTYPCSDSLLHPSIDAELPTAPSAKEIDLPTRNLDTTQLAYINPEDSASDTRLKERTFYHCEGDESEHVCTFEASDATCGSKQDTLDEGKT